ncbi:MULTISPECIES: hypothetical protein [Morganella]|nr:MULTISPECIES: hypothetical protein [Morganella]MDH0356441.1 hypothetical protein [Morganella sp. GD04133]
MKRNDTVPDGISAVPVCFLMGSAQHCLATTVCRIRLSLFMEPA